MQEVPRYLRGYHTCTKEDMFNLGGLLFRVAVDSDRSQFVMIPRMLNELIPADQIQQMQPDEWKKVKKGDFTHVFASYETQETRNSGKRNLTITVKHVKLIFIVCFHVCFQNIISSYNKQSGMTVQEAKIAFLRTMSSWPTFGCSFFDVKVGNRRWSHIKETKTQENLIVFLLFLQQTCEPDYPNILWFTISKKGVSLIDPKTKVCMVHDHLLQVSADWILDDGPTKRKYKITNANFFALNMGYVSCYMFLLI